MVPISAMVEEFERGAWVADLILNAPYEGSFELGGDTWTGTEVGPALLEGGKYLVRVVGGKNGLKTKLAERFYKGGANLSSVIRDILTASGESGTTEVTAPAPTYQRQAATAGQALEQACDTFAATWWADRTGALHVATARPSGEAASGIRVASDIDGSVLLQVQTSAGIAPGLTYEGKTIRHLRWRLSPEKLIVELSFSTFSLPRHTTDYLKQYSAKVDKQNADGSLDLIVGGKFGLTQVTWLTGGPGKVIAKQGDLVSVGFWEGDPRKPYAIGLSASSDYLIDCGTILIGTITTGTAATQTTQHAYIEPGDQHDTEVLLQQTALTAVAPILVRLKGIVIRVDDR
jgi:hypothetical protein